MKYAFALPCYRNHPHQMMVEALCEVQSRLERAGHEVVRLWECNRSDIVLVRNLLLGKAMDAGFDVLTWIDDDIGFRPDDWFRMLERDVPLLCGGYVARSQNPKWTIVNPRRGDRYPTLMAADATGMGFVMSRMPVYEALARKGHLRTDVEGHWHSTAFERIQKPDVILPEDFAFFFRCKDAGFAPYLDPDVLLYHWGEMPFVADLRASMEGMVTDAEQRAAAEEKAA